MRQPHADEHVQLFYFWDDFMGVREFQVNMSEEQREKDIRKQGKELQEAEEQKRRKRTVSI